MHIYSFNRLPKDLPKFLSLLYFFQPCESTLCSTVSPTMDLVSVLHFADLMKNIDSSCFSCHLEKLINLDSWATLQAAYLNFLIYIVYAYSFLNFIALFTVSTICRSPCGYLLSKCMHTYRSLLFTFLMLS